MESMAGADRYSTSFPKKHFRKLWPHLWECSAGEHLSCEWGRYEKLQTGHRMVHMHAAWPREGDQAPGGRLSELLSKPVRQEGFCSFEKMLRFHLLSRAD